MDHAYKNDNELLAAFNITEEDDESPNFIDCTERLDFSSDDSDSNSDDIPETLDLEEEDANLQNIIKQDVQGKIYKKNKRKRQIDTNETNHLLVKFDKDIVIGKDNKTIWSTTPVNIQGKTRSKNIVSKRVRTKGKALDAYQPIDCFKSFFCEEIMNLILEHTNIEINEKKVNYPSNIKTTANSKRLSLRS